MMKNKILILIFHEWLNQFKVILTANFDLEYRLARYSVTAFCDFEKLI